MMRSVVSTALLSLLALATAVLVAVPAPASAQSELQTWLNPRLGHLMPRAEYGLTDYPAQDVTGQGTRFRLLDHGASVFLPLYQDSRNEWSLSGRVGFQDIHTSAVLPSTGDRFPDELWDARLGAGYRHKFDNGWIGGASVTVGSASDRPFASADEMIVRAIGMLRIPSGQRNAWLGTLIYASDSEFLGGLPIPGLAYLYSPSDRFTAVIGFPFSSVQYRPLDKLTLEAQYLPVRRVRARATYALFRPLRLYVGFDWDSDHWLRADREDEQDKLFYYEKRASGGVRFDLRHVGFRLAGGYAFDRFYFEGHDYADRNHNRLDIGSGPFVSAQVSVRF